VNSDCPTSPSPSVADAESWSCVDTRVIAHRELSEPVAFMREATPRVRFASAATTRRAGQAPRGRRHRPSSASFRSPRSKPSASSGFGVARRESRWRVRGVTSGWNARECGGITPTPSPAEAWSRPWNQTGRTKARPCPSSEGSPPGRDRWEMPPRASQIPPWGEGSFRWGFARPLSRPSGAPAAATTTVARLRGPCGSGRCGTRTRHAPRGRVRDTGLARRDARRGGKTVTCCSLGARARCAPSGSSRSGWGSPRRVAGRLPCRVATSGVPLVRKD